MKNESETKVCHRAKSKDKIKKRSKFSFAPCICDLIPPFQCAILFLGGNLDSMVSQPRFYLLGSYSARGIEAAFAPTLATFAFATL